jgi:hypothetical protein
VETGHPDRRQASPVDEETLIIDYQLEVSGPLPVGLIEEIERRCAPAEVRSLDDGLLIRTGVVDQAALGALLGLIWDVGAELRSIRQNNQDGPSGPL